MSRNPQGAPSAPIPGSASASIQTVCAHGAPYVLHRSAVRLAAFEQMAEAHRYLESNQQFGKIVVTL
ncbi:zinc-binding dehydrogenase [Pseudomonas sp. BN411]|uniref:zinc-binding dehydrogenase n=1 Tax=Pseudomonas sp. BN411 TaxID=2567887 RepID=UPI0024562224|nr:zinc-binding dehydrogenase [Pseudomonas sp. BN411]